MNRNAWVPALGWALCGFLVAASADATVSVYTNRTQWEAALSVMCEDFETEVAGNHQTPYTTVNGTLITAPSPGVPIQVFSGGIINGSRELHFRDFGVGVTFQLSLVGSVAFGFDYDASDGPGAHQPNLPWNLTAGGVTTPLAADLPSFIGYIDNQAGLPSFTLTGPRGAQGGISIDNLCVAKASPPPSTCAPPPNTTMVAWYPFDETSGTVSANLATANTGTQFGSPTPITGQVGGALRFNGTSNYVESPSSIATNIGPANGPPFCFGAYSTCQGDFSIDTWIRVDPSVASGFVVVLDKRGGSAPTINGYHFGIYAGSLLLQLADGVGTGYTNYVSPVLTPALTDGNWHLIAVTVQRASTSGIRWYHNGVAVGTDNPTGRTGSLANNSPLRIGTRTADQPLTGWFRGDLDELEIFNRVLTPQEVFTIFQAGTFGKCK